MNETIERDERWLHGLSDYAEYDSVIKDGVYQAKILITNLCYQKIITQECKIIKCSNNLIIESSQIFAYKGIGEFGHYDMSILQNKEEIGDASLHEFIEDGKVILEGSWKQYSDNQSGFWKIVF